MKTAISVPDAIFVEAEKAAKRLGMSRSELYSKAVALYLRRERRRRVKEALDRVYADQPSSLEVAVAALQAVSIDHEPW